MPDDFEEILYNGDFQCIYALLQQLLDFSLADSVAVLRHSGNREWKMVRDVCAESGKKWVDLLGDSNVLDALEILYQQTERPIGWERPAIGGATDPILTIRVWSPGQAYPPQMEGLVVAILHPRRINRHPMIIRDSLVKQKCHRWTMEWFAFAVYRHLALRELWSGNKPSNPGSIGIGTETWGRWPMSFFEISKLIEFEIRNRGPRKVSEIIKDCLKGFHLDSGASCQFTLCRGRPRCHGEPGREQMALLAGLIPLRLLYAEHGEMKPWPAGLDEYERLVSVSNLFTTALSDLFDPTQKLDSLNGKFLTINFARNFWSGWLGLGKQRDFITSPDTSPADKAKMLSCAARLAHFALQQMPRDNETIEALLWAVNKYTIETLGVDPRLEIGSHLWRAARNEPALHTLKPYYRDHFFHAIEVCFLGHLLLDMEYARGKPLSGLVQELMKLRSRKEVLRAWYLAALLHDIGNAVDVLKSAGEMLRFFECSDSLKTLTKNIEAAIDTLSMSLKKSSLKNVEQPGRDHGVVAAEHLEKLIQLVSERLPPWRGYDQAVQAIRVHNLHSETVAFREQPLTFLLVLCDAIQEWNRPHLRYATAPSEILTSLLGAESLDALETTGPLKRVSVNVKPEEEKLRVATPGKLEFELDYGPAIQKDAGVFNLWLGNCSNLQRLKLDGLPFNILLQYKTPQFQDSQGHIERQMDRLREAVDETHLSVLADWFPDCKTNRAVRYEADGDKSEILKLDLRELTKRRRIRADMSAIRERLLTWRRYSEDRDFTGDYAPVNPGYPYRRYPG
jgi:hypothetical protein